METKFNKLSLTAQVGTINSMTHPSPLDASFEASAAIPAPRVSDYGIEATDLKDLNLNHELLKQYNKANRLLVDAEFDEEATLAQKASTINAINSVLSSIIRMQTELYSAERLKTLEAILLVTLKEFPDINGMFLAKYKEALGEHDV